MNQRSNLRTAHVSAREYARCGSARRRTLDRLSESFVVEALEPCRGRSDGRGWFVEEIASASNALRGFAKPRGTKPGKKAKKWRKAPLYVWRVGTQGQLTACVRGLCERQGQSEPSWNLSGKRGITLDGDSLVFAVSRTFDGPVQGMIFGHRNTVVSTDHGMESYEYEAYVSLVYVDARARGECMGAAMTAQVCEQVAEDVHCLMRVTAENGWTGRFVTRITGEAETDGGGRVLGAVGERLEDEAARAYHAHDPACELAPTEEDWC